MSSPSCPLGNSVLLQHTVIGPKVGRVTQILESCSRNFCLETQGETSFVSGQGAIAVRIRFTEKISTLLIIREKQIKTTMRYHLTAVRLANIKKSANDKCWEGCGEKESLLHRWWECKLVQPLWRTVGRFLRKLKTELPYDPAIPLLGIYPDNTINIIKKDTNASMFIAALFTRAKTWRQPQYSSTDEGIKMMWLIYTMEYYSDIEKKERMPLQQHATRDYHTVRKRKTDVMISLIYRM